MFRFSWPALAVPSRGPLQKRKRHQPYWGVARFWNSFKECICFAARASGFPLVRNLENQNLLGPAFGRTDFSRIFIFEPPDFFADFLAGFFSSFLWEKVPRKILQENPRENPPKFIQQKSSNTFLQIAHGRIWCKRHVHEVLGNPN